MPSNPYSNVVSRESSVSSVASFAELMKPELTALSAGTAVFSSFMASPDSWSIQGGALLGLATILVGGGAGALNQWIERDFDLLMKRTERRPLPSGRISPIIALIFGGVLTVCGNALLLTVFGVIPALLGVLTSALYLLVYTPLKRLTWHNTSVGAIPGALPVLIGWTAVKPEISSIGFLLFLMVFAWQYPHFLSLAWLYRKDYARAGFRMLSVIDTDDSRRTSLINLAATTVLLCISLALILTDEAGWVYITGVTGANVLMMLFSFRAWTGSRKEAGELTRLNRGARGLFFASLVFLPIIMSMIVIDKL